MSLDDSANEVMWIPVLAGAAAGASLELSQLGRKGLALATMARLGLAIPATFIIPTHVCRRFLESPLVLTAALREAVVQGITWIEKQTGCAFGGQPGLRLIMRTSPARRTMGLSDAVADITAPMRTDDEERDRWLPIVEAITAAFRSWNHPLARRARMVQRLEEEGLAVIVQQMVPVDGMQMGSKRQAVTRSAVRSWLTRDVRTGKASKVPVVYRKQAALSKAFEKARQTLEQHFADLVELDAVVDGDRLLLLDARVAERDTAANMRMMVGLVDEGLLSPEQALKRVAANDVMQFLLPTFSPAARDRAELLTQGVAASSGVAVGKPAFTPMEVIERAKAGEAVILIRKETYPEDIDALRLAAGILTTTGGMTSHAAVVARGWGKCCIVGAGEIRINPAKRRLHVRGRTFSHEDPISLDGATGQVIAGELPMLKQRLTGDLSKLLEWADKRRTMKVLANADTHEDARRARAMGAQGIGLCRTEHMFFEGDRIESMRQMILASTVAARAAALERLLPWQRRDFIEIFKVMDGLPVTVRLLDPPLHEFLPHDRSAQVALAKSLKLPLRVVQARVSQLHESNPMMGHRGCRLSMSFPEILQMQVRAIVEAAIERKRFGGDPQPAIMHPLVATATELKMLREATLLAIDESQHRVNYTGELSIPIGSMIEVPRAALLADDLAQHADFFSIGTNDLTQLTYGFSRDDSNAFLPLYLERGVLLRDPFESLDAGGVGALVALAVSKARAVKPEISISVCGEHGGDAESIRFFQSIGISAVSSSPFRVPVARLAAGQATAP